MRLVVVKIGECAILDQQHWLEQPDGVDVGLSSPSCGRLLAGGNAGETLRGNSRVGNGGRSCRQVECKSHATNARENRWPVAVGAGFLRRRNQTSAAPKITQGPNSIWQPESNGGWV